MLHFHILLAAPLGTGHMRDVVKITEPGGRILDPFTGSGSTVLAAVLEGYSATGIEVTDAYAALSKERIPRELARSA